MRLNGWQSITPSFKTDYAEFLESLKKNPHQGDDLGNGVRKVRMPIASKGKGKSGGARAITLNILVDEENMDMAAENAYKAYEAVERSKNAE